MAANLSDSYEKVVLVLALLIALGLGGLVYSKSGKIEEDFPAVAGGSNKAPESSRETDIVKSNETFGKPQAWTQGVDPNKRPVDLFTGRNLFLKRGEDQAVDLGDPTLPDVHEGIKNQWWLDHRLDPGWSNSPDLDPDADGFTNREEYDAGSDPNDFKSHGSLITKLRLAKLDKVPYLLTYSAHTCNPGGVAPGDTFQFRVESLNRARNSSDFIPAGDEEASVFFTRKGPGQLRFKLEKVEHIKRLNQRNNIEEDVYTATLTDLAPNKKGTTYTVEKGTKSPIWIRDFTATFFLDAIGQKAVDFSIEENGSFSLPFDPQAADKPYRFKEVRNQDAKGEEEVVIEYTEGGETKELVLKVAAG